MLFRVLIVCILVPFGTAGWLNHGFFGVVLLCGDWVDCCAFLFFFVVFQVFLNVFYASMGAVLEINPNLNFLFVCKLLIFLKPFIFY